MGNAMLTMALGLTVITAAAAHAQAGSASDDELIRNAASAAPATISGEATIVAGDRVVRAGTNGWVCMPDDPARPNNAPMCLDRAWQAFLQALMSREAPEFEGIGIGYMLQGDFPASNTDPFATEQTADNEWIRDAGPHLMLIASDAAMFDGLSTDPHNGGPWVMWSGTQYAHVMVPMPRSGTQ